MAHSHSHPLLSAFFLPLPPPLSVTFSPSFFDSRHELLRFCLLRCICVRASVCFLARKGAYASGRGFPCYRIELSLSLSLSVSCAHRRKKRKRGDSGRPRKREGENERGRDPRSRARIDRSRPRDFHDPSPWPPGHRPKIVSASVRENRTLTHPRLSR